eukprot:2665680-Pyramimonas_sp.AAC.1
MHSSSFVHQQFQKVQRYRPQVLMTLWALASARLRLERPITMFGTIPSAYDLHVCWRESRRLLGRPHVPRSHLGAALTIYTEFTLASCRALLILQMFYRSCLSSCPWRVSSFCTTFTGPHFLRDDLFES